MKEISKRFVNRAGGSAGRTGASFVALALCLVLVASVSSRAQQESTTRTTSSTAAPAPAPTTPRTYPKEIRGFRVELAKVEIRRQPKEGSADTPSPDTDALIQFGEPRIASTTPLGITLEVPITIAAVKQSGRVYFLSFEDMVVNGMPVTVEDYEHAFKLPNREPISLPRPIRLFISTTRALVGALNEWSNPKETWPVTGRVWVFGHFKKFVFSFKRAVPIELNLSLPNPLRNKQAGQKISDPAIKQ